MFFLNLKDLKKQEKEFIKNNLFTYYKQEYNTISLNKSQIENKIKKDLKKIELNKLDYLDIKIEITNALLTQKSLSNEYNTIIEILTRKIKYYSFKIEIDDLDIYIYFNLHNNTSYLINYDSVNATWYLSLIETTSLDLIKEIYSNTYNEFIKYINNLKSRFLAAF